MRRYLLVLTSLELGGAERQAYNLARYLQKKGDMVYVVGLSWPGTIMEMCKEKDIPCTCIDNREVLTYFLLRIVSRLSCFFGGCRVWSDGISRSRLIAKYIRRHDIDVCISYCSPANTIAGMAKKWCRQCVFIWYQRDDGLCGEPFEYRDKVLHSVDVVLANGNEGKRWIENNHHVKTEVIYNGVILDDPLSNRLEWRNRLGVNNNTLVCTMLANFNSNKDHMDLLKAWKTIRDENKDDVFILVLAGRWDEEDYVSKCKDYVERNELTNRVLFLGAVNDISGLLEASDICVFSTKREGNPNGVIEAAMKGLPIIATNLPAIKEVISPENEILLYETHNVVQLVEKLYLLSDEPELRAKIGNCNKKKAERYYSTERNFDKIITLVDRVLLFNKDKSLERK